MKAVHFLALMALLALALSAEAQSRCPCKCRTTKKGKRKQRRRCRKPQFAGVCEVQKCRSAKSGRRGVFCCDIAATVSPSVDPATETPTAETATPEPPVTLPPTTGPATPEPPTPTPDVPTISVEPPTPTPAPEECPCVCRPHKLKAIKECEDLKPHCQVSKCGKKEFWCCDAYEL